MFAIRALAKNIYDKKLDNFVPYILPHKVDYVPIIPNDKFPRSLCRYRDLIYIENSELIDPDENLYFYNAGICKTETGYRLVYRVGKEPKGYEDKLAVCLLDSDFKVVKGSNQYLDVYSCWDDHLNNRKLLYNVLPYKFKNNEHVEDPRIIEYNNSLFVFYTDGLVIGVAKLDKDCKTIYSHYLKVDAFRNDNDGREKNWIPFVKDDVMYILYSSSPRIILTCKDGDKLEITKISTYQQEPFDWKYGNIRGGAPPVKYSDTEFLWFFHSQKFYQNHIGGRITYMIGAYISSNVYPFEVTKYCQLPLLIGIPSEASTTKMLQDCVVFPCGAIETKTGWRIAMGINDADIAFLDVKESDFLWTKYDGKQSKPSLEQ